MKRAMPFLFYGLGGIAVAGALGWASFTVAGQQLSTPADPIHPVAVATSRHSASATTTPTDSPDATPRATHPPVRTNSVVPTPAPTHSIAVPPSPRPHEDGGSHSGDD